jgi:MFS family permease
MSKKRVKTVWPREVWALFASRLIDGVGYSMVLPFITIFLNEGEGVPMTLVGTILLVAAVANAVGQIIGGELADRLGRKGVMVWSLLIRGFIFFLLTLAIIYPQSITVITILLALSYFFGATFEPANNAMVADIVPAGKRTEAYGLLRVGVNVGWVVGPIIGGIIAAASFAWIMLAAGLVSIVSGIVLVFLVRETKPDVVEERQRFGLRAIWSMDHSFLFFCFMALLMFLMAGQGTSTFSVYASKAGGVSEILIGTMFAVNGLMVVLFQFPIARMEEGMRTTNVVAFGSLIYALGFAMLPFCTDYWTLMISMIVITTGEMITAPLLMKAVADLSPEAERGRYMGVFGLFLSFGWMVAPFIGGILMDVQQAWWQMWFPLAFLGVLAAIGFAVLGTMHTKLDPSKD